MRRDNIMASYSSQKSIRVIACAAVMLLMCFALFLAFPSSAHAEETVIVATDTDASDVTVGTPIVAPDGGAEVTEHVDTSDNQVEIDDPSEFSNPTPATATDSDAPDQVLPVYTDNALNRAVESALQQAESNSKSITVTVAAGQYDLTGTVTDITIDTTKLSVGVNLDNSFILYIVADDAGEDYTGANNDVIVNANISISGINVVMAGLYMALDKIITIKNSTTTIYGTTADDTITVVAGDGANVTVNGGAGNDSIALSSDAASVNGSATLNGGDGDDTISVDTSAAAFTSAITLNCGSGSNRLHLTGELDEDDKIGTDTTESPRIKLEGDSILLRNSAEKSLTLSGKSTFVAFTDALANKLTIAIESINEDGTLELADDAGFAPFTNYTYGSGDDMSIEKIVVSDSDLFMSNLVINGEEVVIGEISAPSFNLVINGEQITINGSIACSSLVVKAVDDDITFTIGVGNFEYEASFFDVVSDTFIKLGEDASIDASGTVELSASSSQTKQLEPTGALNFICVKVGSAAIELLGDITAKSVTATTATVVKIIKTGTGALASFIPLALNIAVVSSEITVGENASITAEGSVRMSSTSTVQLEGEAKTGKLEFSLALTVAVVDCHVNVLGNIISNNGDIMLSADSTTNVSTIAKKGTAVKNSGGYFAISIVIQDADVILGGAGSLTAGGSISLTSNAIEKVTTHATSATPAAGTAASGSGGQMSLATIKTTALTLLKQSAGSLVGAAKEKLTGATEKFAGKEYTINKQDTEHGTITVNQRANVEEEVTVTVTPDAGYELDTLKLKYLEKASVSYTFIPITQNASGKYVFTMPVIGTTTEDGQTVKIGCEVTLVATFKEVAGGTTTEDPDVGSLFDDDQSGDGSGITDTFEDGVGGANEATNRATVNATSTNAHTVTTNVSGLIDHGTLVIGITKVNESDPVKVDPDKEVLVIINPNDGYHLKDSQLELIYKQMEDANEITVTEIITANAAGEYVFIMPDADVTVKGAFTNASTTSLPNTNTTRGTTSSSQVVGAVALGVIINNNEASVNTTGSVTAGGTLTVSTDGVTQAYTTADGSPAGTPTTIASATNTGLATATDTNPNLSTSSEKIIIADTFKIGGLVHGNITLVSRNTTTGSMTYAFKVTPDSGYTLTDGTLKIVIRDASGNQVGTTTYALTKDNVNEGQYYIDITGITPGTGNWAVLTAEFAGDSRNITISNGANGTVRALDQYGNAVTSANLGESITIEENPADDYEIGVIKISYGTASATTLTRGADGLFTFTMPTDIAVGAALTITSTFVEKGFDLNCTGVTFKQNGATITRADAGETVTFCDPTGTALTKGSYSAITAVLVDSMGEDYVTITITAPTTDTGAWTWTLPTTIDDPDTGGTRSLADFGNGDAYFKFILDKATGKASITYAQVAGGTISGRTTADESDEIELIITPAAGYMLKTGSIQVVLRSGQNVETRTVSKSLTTGKYIYTMPAACASGTTLNITGTFIQDSSANSSGRSVSLGVGVAVSVVKHTSSATIKSGTIDVQGISISADSGSSSERVTASCIAKAGYSTGNIGIGGAIAVQVASLRTQALVYNTAAITLANGGSISINASSYERTVVQADCTPNASTGSTTAAGTSGSSKGSVGVGAGLAIGVSGIDVTAAIQDGTSILLKTAEAELSSLNISASHDLSETMLAKAGSSGGTSVTPVLALLVSGADVQAYFGMPKANDPILTFTGDAELSAVSAITRELSANASAAGGSVGVGGSFAISVLNDSAVSRLSRSVTAKNVSLLASSKNALTSTSRAGSQGATNNNNNRATRTSATSTATGTNTDSGDGESDRQANRALNGGSRLADQTGSNNTNSSKINGASSNRQTAQTTEGNVQIAAGFALNILTNRAESRITDGITVTANGTDTTADDGTVTRGGVVSVISYARTNASVSANAAATNAKIGVGVAIAINVINYDNIAYIENAAINANHLDVLALMITDPIKPKTAAPVASEDNIIVALVRGMITEWVAELVVSMNLSDTLAEHLEDVVNDLIDATLKTGLDALLANTGLSGLLAADLPTRLKNNFNDLLDSDFPGLKQALDGFEFTPDNFLDLAIALITDMAKNVTGGSTSTFTQKLASIKALTGDPATAMTELFTGMLQKLGAGIIDIAAFKTFIRNGIGPTLQQNLKTAVQNIGKALTTVVLDELSYWLELTIEPESNASYNKFVTTAIAGAGASSVGIAGSVAVAVINGVTSAMITDLAEDGAALYPITVTGDTFIKALSNQFEDTTATSAVTDGGIADKNLAAGSSDVAAATGTDTGTSLATSGTKTFAAGGMTNGGAVSGTIASSGNQYDAILKPAEGYTLAQNANGKYIVSYTRSDTGATDAFGTSGVAMTVTPQADGTFKVSYLYKTTDSAKLATTTNITINATFEEDLHTISGLGPNTAAYTTGTSTTGKAKMGDRVVIAAASGYKLNVSTPTYKVGTDAAKTIVTTEITTAGGTAYVFYMPDGDVTINGIWFTALTETEQQAASQTNINQKGKTVGVGAAFGFTYADMEVSSGIGENRTVTTGTLAIRADGTHKGETYSVSGTDPLNTAGSTTTSKAKDIAIDASAAVTLLFNDIRTTIGAGAVVLTTGGNTVNINEKEYLNDDGTVNEADTEANRILVNFSMYASENVKTLTQASGFATGNTTAVGAAVTVNIVESNVVSELLGSVTANGIANIEAYS